MREAHPIERAVGIDHYVSDAAGVGGRLRDSPEAFRVREREQFAAEPVDSDPGDYHYLVFRATLRGWDTNDFVGQLSNELGISRERISWAGTKDKRAVTTQLFTVDGIEPNELPEINAAELTVVGRAGRAITFGDLAGNEFEIVVTDAERPENADRIVADLAKFSGSEDGTTVGVPNWFGQQRFGSRRPITHEVGLRILDRDWEGAVMAYVGSPHEAEPEGTREARSYVEETRDWTGALDRFPGRLGHERAMLHRLAEADDPGPDEFRAAVEQVPSNLQRLFVNAAQSYAFNRIVSERLDRGLPFDRPVEGDVVCFADTDAPDGFVVPDQSRTQRVTGRRVDSITRHCERGRAFVTAPLVGTATELGRGTPGEIERSVLSELGVRPEAFDLPGSFESTGTRRPILVRTELDVGHDPLSVSFGLPSGSYATVVLREFLKADPVEMG